MIGSVFHLGSGLGDQLFRFITSKTLAVSKKVNHGMVGPNNFKGSDFMKIPLDHGMNVGDPFSLWFEKELRDPNGVDTRSYDPEINFVQDNTIIDGSFEDDKYWRHNLDNISKWLAVEPYNVPDTNCVVGFRGGEYATQKNLFLPPTYFTQGIITMTESMKVKNFECHTDDSGLAASYLESHVINGELKIVDNQPISHSKHTNMGLNWRAMRYAKYAVIPNSAFYIIPRILKHHEDPGAVTIAPRYWARRNTKVWARPACYYPEFTYL